MNKLFSVIGLLNTIFKLDIITYLVPNGVGVGSILRFEKTSDIKSRKLSKEYLIIAN